MTCGLGTVKKTTKLKTKAKTEGHKTESQDPRDQEQD